MGEIKQKFSPRWVFVRPAGGDEPWKLLGQIRDNFSPQEFEREYQQSPEPIKERVMTEKEMKRQYDELVENIEDTRMFDGRGSGVDVYTCDKCGAKFYTQYVHKGVTPFTISCRNCKHGTAVHRNTISLHLWVQLEVVGEKLHNWVRPSFEQLQKLSPGLQRHVLQGGLMLEDELQ
jgi:hypothetical protein